MATKTASAPTAKAKGSKRAKAPKQSMPEQIVAHMVRGIAFSGIASKAKASLAELVMDFVIETITNFPSEYGTRANAFRSQLLTGLGHSVEGVITYGPAFKTACDALDVPQSKSQREVLWSRAVNLVSTLRGRLNDCGIVLKIEGQDVWLAHIEATTGVVTNGGENPPNLNWKYLYSFADVRIESLATRAKGRYSIGEESYPNTRAGEASASVADALAVYNAVAEVERPHVKACKKAFRTLAGNQIVDDKRTEKARAKEQRAEFDRGLAEATPEQRAEAMAVLGSTETLA